MAPLPDNVLSYASPPNSWARLRAIRKRTWVKLGVLALIASLAFVILREPITVQIRLDSGDLRYCWWGIPYEYQEFPKPQRTKLLALSAVAPAVPARWFTCASAPNPEWNPHRSCRYFYYCIAIWSDEDPRIARWALEDFQAFIPHMFSGGTWPESTRILSGFVVDTHGLTLDPNWRDDESVKYYCSLHGYTPPPPKSPATTRITGSQPQ